MSRLGLLLICIVAWLATFAPTANATDFTKPGPFAVGLQTFTIPDVTGKHPMPALLWYPATGPAPDPTMAVLKATKDAPPATTGPYPLVVVIHGLNGVGVIYSTLSSQLASYGFVVVAADYDDGLIGPPDDGVSPDDRTAIWLLYDHPADVVQVIGFADSLTVPGGKLAGIIDTSHIGVFGHSTGGSAVFQAGGARIDFKELDDWCVLKHKDYFAGETCQFVGHEKAVAALYGATDPFAAPMPSLWDKRVSALVAGAPGGEMHSFGDTGIAAVKVPTLIMVATDDGVVSPEYNGLWAYDGIASQDKALAVFSHGGHTMFGATSGAGFNEAKALTTAFFLDILKGDPAGKAALMPDAVSFPGLSYKTTLH